MRDVPDYYTTLSNAIANAMKALDRGDPLSAKMLLKQGRFQAEEQYLAATGGKLLSEEDGE